MEQESLPQTMSEGERRFWEFHTENPKVWELFKRFTQEAINAGFKHYSAWAIVQRLRWHSAVETRGDDYKINNNFIAYYARLFHAEFPQYDGFFRTRELKR